MVGDTLIMRRRVPLPDAKLPSDTYEELWLTDGTTNGTRRVFISTDTRPSQTGPTDNLEEMGGGLGAGPSPMPSQLKEAIPGPVSGVRRPSPPPPSIMVAEHPLTDLSPLSNGGAYCSTATVCRPPDLRFEFVLTSNRRGWEYT
jgi:ELWxxDGT repeat protein